MNIVQGFIDFSTSFISRGGITFGFFIVMLESFLPFLPLSFFVALNVNAFGFITGCLISWLGTCLGSYICYLFFLFVKSKIKDKILNKKIVKRINKSIEKFSNIKFTELVLIMTLPFTPSFLINILSGLTNMSKNKFSGALMIGKSFTVIFWGYIGKSLLESLTDLKSLTYIIGTLLLAYLLSKIIGKKWNIQ